MKDTVPDAKIIFIIRDPVERMWSEYLYFYNLVHGDKGYSTLLNDLQHVDNFGEHHRRRGDYATTCKKFSSHFSDIMIVVFEEMNIRPRQMIADICEFIDVSDDDHILDSMPLDTRFNQTTRHEIPKNMEEEFLRFHADNYASCIQEFGNRIKNWKYFDNFQ